MRKFLINCSAFLCVVLILLFFLDNRISKGLSSMDDHRYKVWNDIVKGNIDADVVFLGSSRTAMGCNVDVFDSILNCRSYNLGIEGYQLNVQLLRFYTYVEHNPKPQWVVLNIDRNSFLYATFSLDKEQILPFVHDTFLHDRLEKYGISKLELNLPYYRYFGYTDETFWGLLEGLGLAHYKHIPVTRGYIVYPYKGGCRQLDDYTENDVIKENLIDERMVKMFEDFVDWCYSNDVNLLLINMPIYKTSSEITYKSPALDLLKQYIEEKDLLFWDYGNNEMSLQREFYADNVHLNPTGARYFTTVLANQMNSLINE